MHRFFALSTAEIYPLNFTKTRILLYARLALRLEEPAYIRVVLLEAWLSIARGVSKSSGCCSR